MWLVSLKINVISMKDFEIIIEKKKLYYENNNHNNIGKSQCITYGST